MKTLSTSERAQVIGPYTAPRGFYELVKSTPFLGGITCSTQELIAGEWTEILMTYTVGASGLADGAWIKATFKFYSDWALFQTSDPAAPNYVSAEYEAAKLVPGQIASTVQALKVRFDQKGHERPFQKSIIVDIVDGFLNVGDKIHIRLGDRRAGGAGTRVQTFVEKDFRFRFYVDPIGTSRFATVKGDVKLQILAGPPHRVVVLAPRLLGTSPDARDVIIRVEDAWGNTTTNTPNKVNLAVVNLTDTFVVETRQVTLPQRGWSTLRESLVFQEAGTYEIQAEIVIAAGQTLTGLTLVTVEHNSGQDQVFYGDLHVHSEDTVGTNDSLYNFTYARECAGLDVVGYTANDFNITKTSWDATVKLIDELNESGKFVIYPGTEWCGNTAVGGDHNVVFFDEKHREFPFDKDGNIARSFEWNEELASQQIEPGTWPIDDLYATYAHAPESHLLIPHIGGRRANLGWHHPKLERLIEIGSAWGHFEWFYKDAIRRGYKLGVSANSDEHRGRCGGGVPGTAVFGTRGGLTGIISSRLDRPTIGSALRSRHTFATTGQRLVALSWVTDAPQIKQGDETTVSTGSQVRVSYRVLGQAAGIETIELHGKQSLLEKRDLGREAGLSRDHVRVRWGGSRIKDRYREAIWKGKVTIANGIVRKVTRMCPDDVHPEEAHWIGTSGDVHFKSSTSGDADGLVLEVEWLDRISGSISVEGSIEGYVKVGDPLAPNPYRHAPGFQLSTSMDSMDTSGHGVVKQLGGADLFVALEPIAAPGSLPREVEGSVDLPTGEGAVWLSATQSDGAKVWTSPIFFSYAS